MFNAFICCVSLSKDCGLCELLSSHIPGFSFGQEASRLSLFFGSRKRIIRFLDYIWAIKLFDSICTRRLLHFVCAFFNSCLCSRSLVLLFLIQALLKKSCLAFFSFKPVLKESCLAFFHSNLCSRSLVLLFFIQACTQGVLSCFFSFKPVLQESCFFQSSLF